MTDGSDGAELFGLRTALSAVSSRYDGEVGPLLGRVCSAATAPRRGARGPLASHVLVAHGQRLVSRARCAGPLVARGEQGPSQQSGGGLDIRAARFRR